MYSEEWDDLVSLFKWLLRSKRKTNRSPNLSHEVRISECVDKWPKLEETLLCLRSMRGNKELRLKWGISGAYLGDKVVKNRSLIFELEGKTTKDATLFASDLMNSNNHQKYDIHI